MLVGTHGAALVNALFMRRGGALLEVRPYNFDGAWPDRYHLAMAQRENATHAFVVRTRNRSLCTPVPPANVSAWNAPPLNTHVREAAFTAGLAAAACTSGRAAAAGAASARRRVERPARRSRRPSSTRRCRRCFWTMFEG